jgi:hypothetical protein
MGVNSRYTNCMVRLSLSILILLAAGLPAAAHPGIGIPVPSASALVFVTDETANPKVGFEETMWNIVKKSRSPADYEAYLEVFPKGRFAEKARAALARLRAEIGAANQGKSRSIVQKTPEKLEGIGRTYIVRSTANLRAGPGTDTGIVGRAAAGESIFVLGRVVETDWFKVSNRAGVVAYIAASLVGPPKMGAPTAPARRETPAPAAPATSAPPDASVPAPVSAPPPQPAESAEEIRKRWMQKIDAVKASGPHGSCDLVVGSKWEDPSEYDLCEENNAKIKSLEQEMERKLADR